LRARTDPPGARLIVSALHSSQDVERTLEGFDRAIGLLQKEGTL
jgi:hypothetical protein